MPKQVSGRLSADTVEEQLRKFLAERTKIDWEPEQDLFASGEVSSLFAMELVVFLEKTFDIMVEREDLLLDNFRTMAAMIKLVIRLRKIADA